MAQLDDFSKIIVGGNEIGKVLHQGKTIWQKEPDVYLAQDSDFVKVNGYWVYRGSELEIKIPYVIQGESITRYSNMFRGDSPYNANLVTRVVSDNLSVTNMGAMFYNSKVTTLDLSSFDTSSVTNMGDMFNNSKVTTLDLSSFDTSKVTNMNSMFYNSAAATLDLSSFDTSSVTNMSAMFYNSKVTTLDLSSFDTSSVTNMSAMFYNSKVTTLDLSSFDTSSVTNMGSMFRESKVTTLDLSSFDTSNVTSIDSMFSSSAVTIGYARTQTDANKFNSSSGKPAGLNFVVKP